MHVDDLEAVAATIAQGLGDRFGAALAAKDAATTTLPRVREVLHQHGAREAGPSARLDAGLP